MKDDQQHVRISLGSHTSVYYTSDTNSGVDDGRVSINSQGFAPVGHAGTKSTGTSGQSNLPKQSGRPTTRKSMMKMQQKQEELLKKKRTIPKYIRWSRKIVENNFVVTLTTLLTMYALVGDDMRMLCFQQPADNIFNAITVTCIIVFLVEIVLSCFGKDDYFWSFFFWLDCISTGTLVLDLTWINESIQGDEEDVDKISGSDTARLGARTARVVRVLRLVRILKLYKAVYEARAKQKKAEERRAMAAREQKPGEEQDDFDDADDTQDEVKIESLARGSRVGKVLSDRTTRKVIILVLSMMLFSPILRVDPADQFAFSPHYAADLVHESYEKWQQTASSVELRRHYVNQLLQLIYYHNWYAGQQACVEDKACPNEYYNHAYWIGIVSTQDTDLEPIANKASLTTADVDNFEKENVGQDYLFIFESLPPSVQKTLGSNWTQRCDTGRTQRLGFSLLSHKIAENSYVVNCPENLRKLEREKFSARVISTGDAKIWHFGFYFDKRKYTRQESVFSLLTTAFVVVMLTGAALTFTNSAEVMVLHPLEIMISKVDRIRDNPLAAMKMSDEEFRQEEVRKTQKQVERTRFQKAKDKILCKSREAPNEPMETVILEKTIIKIGSLLALGFGEAGANIIEQNMSASDSANVSAMIDGDIVDCIIGCARIKHFGTATEVLKGDVMVFVNRISEIVHGVVDEFHGAANKNNGDMFLMIWKTSDLDEGYASRLADMSMVAFTRILGAVNRSPVLAAYRSHPRLQQKMGKARPKVRHTTKEERVFEEYLRQVNDFRVTLTFSLHYGWAIEGAVGSEFKIDASYLSPNVSIAESLEAATHIYGVSIMASQAMCGLCSEEVAAKCRLIDRVLLTGETMDLYCIDVDYRSLSVLEAPPSLPAWTPRQRYKVRQFLETEKSLKWGDDVEIVHFFDDDADISTMRFRYTLEFTQVFAMGYQNYAEGEWRVAQRFLKLTKSMLGTEDGPSAAILNYMESFGDEAPPTWKGVRDLDTSLRTSRP
jgi:class 3 adenylate cyclase